MPLNRRAIQKPRVIVTSRLIAHLIASLRSRGGISLALVGIVVATLLCTARGSAFPGLGAFQFCHRFSLLLQLLRPVLPPINIKKKKIIFLNLYFSELYN